MADQQTTRSDEKADSRAEDEARLARGEVVRNGLFSSLKVRAVKIIRVGKVTAR
jgi:hypothetical protein